jgi:hypothetical protein
MYATIEERCFRCVPRRGVTLKTIKLASSTSVKAGSNTSSVALRVVGGDETGSLESETVKYGREPQGTQTRE